MPVKMTAEIAKALREPFQPEFIGKLPRIWCRACRDVAKRSGACDQHRRSKCRACNSNITEAHLHLDYVGHAETTDRFLAVDPEWTWEPMAFGPDGLPALDRNGGLWIKLTIAGVTRLGYGAAEGKSGPDAIKEIIGDALRNAGMRFGVGLDLWGATFKDGSESGNDDHEVRESWDKAAPYRPQQPEAPSPAQVKVFDDLAKLVAAAESLDSLKAVWEATVEAFGKAEITTVQGNQIKAAITERRAEVQASTPEAVAA